MPMAGAAVAGFLLWKGIEVDYGVFVCSLFYLVLAWSRTLPECFGDMQDEDAFFRDYAVSHKKLSELGFTPHSSGSKATVKDSTILVQSAVGVAVAAAVVVLSYLYEVRKKIK